MYVIRLDAGYTPIDITIDCYSVCLSFLNVGEATDVLSDVLEDCIYSMRTGEKCKLEIQSSMVKDAITAKAQTLKAAVTIFYLVDLLSFKNDKDVWDLTNQERLSLSRELKGAGTERFKAGEVQSAAVCYSSALKYLIPVGIEKADGEAVSLRIALLLNLAACHLKFEQNNHVVSNCTKVLELDPDNLKAIYRRGVALTRMNHLEKAKEEFARAKELEPSNRAVLEQLRMLEAKEKEHMEKYRSAMKAMFSA